MQPFSQSQPQEPFSTVGYHPVAEYTEYRDAQGYVDFLSDSGFPVESVQIVGKGLHSVEQITGRLTKGKAAGAGALSGVWFGLLIGLLFGLFVAGVNWFWVVIGAALISAAWGAIFGYLAQSATRGQRDFASRRTITADTYVVQVHTKFIAQAQDLLAKWRLKGHA